MALVAILSFVSARGFSSPGCQGRCYRHYTALQAVKGVAIGITQSFQCFGLHKYMAANAL